MKLPSLKWFTYHLCAIAVLASLVLASDVDDNASVIAPADLGQYLKSKTQFDGITPEEYVTYLTLTSNQFVQLPLLTTGKTNTNLSFTIAFWFKLSQKLEGESRFLFGVPGSVQCYLTSQPSIMCDSADRIKLEIPSSSITAGKWLHLVLSVKDTGSAYLMLHDNLKIIGVDTVQQGFTLTQTVAQGWSICFSNCGAYSGFNGGVREVIAKSTFMSAETAFESSHLIQVYANDFKCYFRFNNAVQDYEAFNKDEFVDRTWTQFFDKSLNQTASDIQGSNLTISSLIGRDYIPNDICPFSYDYDDFVVFSTETTLQTVTLSTNLPQTKYSYTVSMTILVNDTSCTTFDPLSVDSSSCHFVHLDSVFAIYFEQSNMARIRFYALKNYYETTSKAFFIPFDQWVTIQFTMEQYAGYQIYVLDMNGKPIVKQTLKTNLQIQRPKPNLTLFRSMIGSVADFRLCNQLFTIPINESLMSGCLVQFQANSANVQGISIPNAGSVGGSLTLNTDPAFIHVPYEDTYYGSNATYGVANSINGQQFDGIACHDGQATVQLVDKHSYFRFNTPVMQDWMSENTIEFWIKPVVTNSKTYFEGTKTIFQMVNSITGDPYFQVYIKDGNLVCAPFGLNQNITGVFDPTVSTDLFTMNNTDKWGWWHISCGYQFQNKIQMTLHNNLVDSIVEKSLVGTTFFVPKEFFKASLNQPFTNETGPGLGSLLIKEVRFWAKFRDSTEIKNWRRSQIDPSVLPANNLLTYFRLGADNLDPWNFAEVQAGYNYTETQPVLQGAVLVLDVVYTNEYVWNNDISLFEIQQISNYHTVCPLHTFLNKDYCYGEPMNKVKLTVVPVFKNDTLAWVFSTLYSSSINQDLIPTLFNEWTAENNLLNYNLQSQGKETGQREISPQVLRQENDYKVTVALFNHAITFREEDTIDFVPNQCQWFEVEGSDAQNGKAVFNSSPGQPDINFKLILKTLKKNGCDQSDFFYDEFLGLDFDYMIFDDIQYMELLPAMKFEVSGSKATNNLTVSVTVPKEEQWKFPIRTDVKIIMNVKWTSSKFADLVDTSNLVFQNVIYTIRFNPAASVLIPKLKASSDLLYQNDTLILDASGTFVTGLSNQKSRMQIQYSWVCPDIIKNLCLNKTKSILNITYADLSSANQTNLFGQPLTVQVVILWVDGSLYPPTETLNHTIEWLNVPKIQFTIESNPSTILLTSQMKTLFTISESSIQDSQYGLYQIDWAITPPLEFAAAQSTTNSDQNLVVEAGNWAERTEYSVSVSVSPKIKPELVTKETFKFETTSFPKDSGNGTVAISPKAAEFNTPITVSIQSWTSENGDITWNVYQSLDQLGTIQGPLLNEEPLLQSETFTYKASKSPVIVQITDPKGESVYVTKKVEIIIPKTTPAVNTTTPLPIVNQTVKTPPVTNTSTVTTPPVTNTTTVTTPPVANTTTVTTLPVANTTTVTTLPVVQTTPPVVATPVDVNSKDTPNRVIAPPSDTAIKTIDITLPSGKEVDITVETKSAASQKDVNLTDDPAGPNTL